MGFRNFTINNIRYDLSHLSDFDLYINAENDKRIKARVRFSCHCFTREVEYNDKPDVHYYWNNECRAICLDRYELSKTLVNFIKHLPSHRVHRKDSENFFVIKAVGENGKKLPYVVFFDVFKASGQYDVNIIINSAYVKPNMIDCAPHIRFSNLVRLKAMRQKIILQRSELISWL